MRGGIAALLGVCICTLGLQPASGQQNDPPEALNTIYQTGIAAFNAGDFAAAIDNLSKLTDQVPENQLEPIYFTLGAAYLNSRNYGKAIDLFQIYLSKYKDSVRIPDATFALVQCYLALGKTDLAAALALKLEASPIYREQALLFGATAAKSAGRPGEAITILERLVGGSIQTRLAARGAMMLASLYVEKNDDAKAASLFEDLQKNVSLVENVVGLNSLAVELGDIFLAREVYPSALACYRAVRLKDEVVRLQKERIADMGTQVEANLAAIRANPPEAARYLSENQQIRGESESAQKLLGKFEEIPDVLAAVYMRMARCYYQDGRPWESIVVYEELLKKTTASAERETASYALVVIYSEVNQPKIATARIDDYLREFPTGTNAATVSYLKGSMALQAQDYTVAESWFGSILADQPNNPMREQIRLLMGNAKFSQGKYSEAVEEYRKYLEEFPTAPGAEECDYRIALARLFDGKYDDASALLNTYLQKHAQGRFVSDAKYRLQVCDYANQKYSQVIAGCDQWQKQFPGDPQTGEVLALKADALTASEKVDEAISVYTAASKAATTDEVMNYALFEASKLLQKKGDWEKVSALFENFIKDKPEHPTVLAALYWIGKAKVRLGKVDEAKVFLATTIKKYLNDPSREPVELMLTQLVQICAKKQRPIQPTGEAPAEAVAPTLDPAAELDSLLGSNTGTPTAKARILFAKAELAGLRKKADEQEKLFRQIIANTKVEELSPMLLARLGDFLLQHGETEKAAGFFEELKDIHPKSDVVDFAYAGLGEIALGKGDAAGALKLFSYGTDKIAAAQKLKEITLGKARALFALGRLDEARKLFEQVASVRQWRGDATAESVYLLGKIEQKQGRWPEANAYFQRVFVAYQRYTGWAAKSYLDSGACFEKLGKTQEARNTYNEMLRQDKLASLPEAEAARQRLKEIGPG